MNMPGFTAEASLFRASEHYHMPDNFEQAGGAVYPAQIPVPDGPILGPSPGPITPITILHRCHYLPVWEYICGPHIKCFWVFRLKYVCF